MACGGQVEEDPSVHYYVPGVPLDQARARRARSASADLQIASRPSSRRWPAARRTPASKAGLASLLKTIWAGEYDDERDARFINDRVHANIQKDGTFSVVPRIYGGVTNADELRRIADVAEKYNVPMVKITGGQRIDLLGIKKEDLPEVWQDLGMPSRPRLREGVPHLQDCVGTEFCRYGVGDSTRSASKIEQRFQGIEVPAQDEARHGRLPAQLLRSATSRTSAPSPSRAAMGDLRRRRRRRARAQRRHAVHRRHAR